MKKRLMVVVATAALAMGVLPGTASAGMYCEFMDPVGAGDACRTAGSIVIDACNKVVGIRGNECGLQ